ncbi:MAG: hypothetical protein A2X03_09890 [Bacteroidetes bacterium GWA2_40_15]|nr:MAG: hypothetical protein A2X03_09890 [Bacteroidetes bacterium GWA2_40_15]
MSRYEKISLEQMEVTQGGDISAQCAVSLGGAFVFGTLAIIGAASGPIGWLAVGMAANYFGWGMTA